MREKELIEPKIVKKMLGVASSTLRRWAKEGKIRYVRLPSGRLRYYKSDIERILYGEKSIDIPLKKKGGDINDKRAVP